MTLAVLALLALTISLEVARELCFKLAANRSDKHLQNSNYLARLFGTPIVWLGFACWATELMCWIRVLSQVPLSIAFPILSISYCGMVLAGEYILKEPVAKQKWLGVALVTAGVALLGTQGVA